MAGCGLGQIGVAQVPGVQPRAALRQGCEQVEQAPVRLAGQIELAGHEHVPGLGEQGVGRFHPGRFGPLVLPVVVVPFLLVVLVEPAGPDPPGERVDVGQQPFGG